MDDSVPHPNLFRISVNGSVRIKAAEYNLIDHHKANNFLHNAKKQLRFPFFSFMTLVGFTRNSPRFSDCPVSAGIKVVPSWFQCLTDRVSCFFVSGGNFCTTKVTHRHVRLFISSRHSGKWTLYFSQFSDEWTQIYSPAKHTVPYHRLLHRYVPE